MEDKNVESVEDGQVAESVDEIDEEIVFVIYRLYDKTRDIVNPKDFPSLSLLYSRTKWF
ncbi:hypothetical protein [Lysinibacillus xylanilyticus]|uniref:hypothetical protein n=1 Tax=Lysinibacillus xylanilyticus TaxID=582475 RepID=UPI0037F5784B